MIVTNTFNENLSEESKQNWLSYWNHFNNNEYQFCAEHNCINKHHHGVLVKQTGFSDDRLFVIPLCKEHSANFLNPIELDEKVSVVPAELSL
ncbi:hypothetical protein DEB41_08090 [Vibrio anguillarum]|uniref:Uncharacterized protein n=2 Tax=Vibrio anguillarum TaxID=55601 RepID=A0A1Y0NXC9_VIBAN|nr:MULTISPECIES: hypothetical protein [Vibrio]AEH33330.1 hypothetical protein VAA_02031 [Vibrio anguillarum 775]AGU58898.1 hypothetical protein N175_08915 [Vibrio anguillarum M3]ARV26009.1 hypothetical protein A6A12_1075 [Vibrio anguillarum]ASF91729.1 hypothetical protein CEA93_06645 [Vibrio anguillarum]ATA49610.1 hypothetical protein CLI14_07655 [Vibrio anguillarum]